MRKLIWTTLTLLVSGTLLSSCTWFSSSCIPPDASYGAVGIPETTLDQGRAMVGESITATLSAELELPDCSEFAERPWLDLTLGACFSRMDGEEVVSRGGLCEPGGVPLPDGITLSNDKSHIRKFGDYVVRRGETRLYSHTFTFAATEPGTFRLNSLTQYASLRDPNSSDIFFGGSHEVVVFE